MKPPVEWSPKQLALAVYAHLYAIADLGMPLGEILRLAGLSMGQWTTRITLDFPTQDGASKYMPRVDRWHEEYTRLKQMPRDELKQVCTTYLEKMRVRKGLSSSESSAQPRVAILDDYDRLASTSPAIAELHRFADVRIFHEGLAAAYLPLALAGCSAVIPIRERTRFTEAVLASLPDLRHLAQTGSGVAHIDVNAATRLGIAVSVTPGGSAQSVAELTLGLLLALVHRVGEGDRAIRRGEWPPLLGSEVGGKTLGLIGLGEIGKEVAVRARAFGMRLLAWSPNLTPERAQPHGAHAVSLDELITQSDFLSVHIRLSDQTRGLISYDRLRQAKPGLILINTSRGPITPEPDVLRALKDGTLGGAALDVFDEEPLPAGHPFMTLPNVILTPHVGWTTKETYKRFFAGAVGNLRAFYNGTPEHVLNPDAGQRRPL